MSKTEARITLAIDAMGGDQGPQEVLAGVSKAVEVSPRNTHFALFGQEDVLHGFVQQDLNLSSSQVSIHHAPEVVGMDEKPIAGIKGKKNSSMSLALNALKEGEADALLSCGNTGCLMAGSAIRLARSKEWRDLLYARFGPVVKDISPCSMQGPIRMQNLITYFKMQYLVLTTLELPSV